MGFEEVFVGDEVGHGAIGDDGADVDDDHARADFDGVMQVVGGDETGAGEATQDVGDGARAAGVEIGPGLIKGENSGMAGEDGGYGRPFFFRRPRGDGRSGIRSR